MGSARVLNRRDTRAIFAIWLLRCIYEMIISRTSFGSLREAIIFECVLC